MVRPRLLGAVVAFASLINAQVDLGTALSFGVLGGSTVTNTGPTIVDGDVGVSPGTAIVGFPPGTITNGVIHAADAVAAQAQADITTAYNAAAAQAPTEDLTGQDLGGQTLVAGVYNFDISAQLTGALTLDGQGDPDSVWIFQIGTTLTTATASSVTLINGASFCNIFWQVGSSATLGASTSFVGNVLAQESITLITGASSNGGLYARAGAVTLDTNRVISPRNCDLIVSSVPPSQSATGTSSSSSSSSSTGGVPSISPSTSSVNTATTLTSTASGSTLTSTGTGTTLTSTGTGTTLTSTSSGTTLTSTVSDTTLTSTLSGTTLTSTDTGTTLTSTGSGTTLTSTIPDTTLTSTVSGTTLLSTSTGTTLTTTNSGTTLTSTFSGTTLTSTSPVTTVTLTSSVTTLTTTIPGTSLTSTVSVTTLTSTRTETTLTSTNSETTLTTTLSGTTLTSTQPGTTLTTTNTASTLTLTIPSSSQSITSFVSSLTKSTSTAFITISKPTKNCTTDVVSFTVTCPVAPTKIYSYGQVYYIPTPCTTVLAVPTAVHVPGEHPPIKKPCEGCEYAEPYQGESSNRTWGGSEDIAPLPTSADAAGPGGYVTAGAGANWPETGIALAFGLLAVGFVGVLV